VVSRDVLVGCRGPAARFETDIAIRRLSSEEWTERDITELVQAITQRESLSETVADAFKIIPEAVPPERVTKFAVALLEELSSTEADEPRTKATAIVLERLVGILHQRLCRPDQAQYLGNPATTRATATMTGGPATHRRGSCSSAL
jgi:hypothetical protein